MSTVAEKPKSEMKTEAKPEPAWNLRQPKIGDRVLWYVMADARTQAVPGVVIDTGINHMVGIVTFTDRQPARFCGSIPHINDPRLKLNMELRKGGGWDYFVDPLEERIKVLESLMK